MHLLCTFAVLPTGRLTYASAVHIRCAASSAQNLQHVGGCAHSLRCQQTAPPVPLHTIPLVAAAVHILCAASKTGSPDIFLNMQSVPAVHILCAASTHHGRIRSMLLSFCVECICCAHSLCCQQRAKSSARRWLCTFSALPTHSTAGTMAYNSAGRCCCAHPLCCQQDRLPRHFSQYAIGACCAHSLRCQHTSRPHS